MLFGETLTHQIRNPTNHSCEHPCYRPGAPVKKRPSIVLSKTGCRHKSLCPARLSRFSVNPCADSVQLDPLTWLIPPRPRYFSKERIHYAPLTLSILALCSIVSCGEEVQTIDLPPENAEDQYTYPGDVFDSGNDPFGDCAYGYADCDGYGGIDCADDPCVFGTCTEASYEGDFCACPNGYTGPPLWRMCRGLR